MKKFVMSAIACLMALCLFPMSAMAAGKDTAESATGVIEQIKQELKEAFDSVDEETTKEIFSFIKEKVDEGELDSAQDIKNAIKEGEEKFNVEIDEADAKKLVETMEKLEDMGFSIEYVVQKADSLYQEHGADFVEHVDEVVTGAVKDAASNVANSFFEGLKTSVKSFFQNLFQ